MKKIYWIILITVIIIVNIVVVTISYKNDNNNEIPSNYIAIFKGESAEVVHTTYLYEKKKGKKKTYKYINTISTLSGYDSSIWNEDVIKKGKLKKKNKIFEIAEKNEAYSYVKNIKDDQIYSIEEYKEIISNTK